MKPIIRIIAIVFFALCSSTHSSLGQETSTPKSTLQTRSMTLSEAVPKDSILSSPLLSSREHISIQNSIAQYKIVSTEALKILNDKGKPENIFWKSWFCIYQTITLTVQSQKNAITLMLPVFIVIFILVFLYPSIKTFFFRPYLVNATKPTNAEFHANIKKQKEASIEEEDPIDEEDLDEDEEAFEINENN